MTSECGYACNSCDLVFFDSEEIERHEPACEEQSRVLSVVRGLLRGTDMPAERRKTAAAIASIAYPVCDECDAMVPPDEMRDGSGGVRICSACFDEAVEDGREP